jgi:hypothetical protein
MFEPGKIKAVGRVLLVVGVVLVAVPALASFENQSVTTLDRSDPDAGAPPFLPEAPRARLRDQALADRDRPDDVRGAEKGFDRPDIAPERFDRARPVRPDVPRPERPERPPSREIERPERSPVEVPSDVRPERTQIG